MGEPARNWSVPGILIVELKAQELGGGGSHLPLDWVQEHGA